MSTAPEAGPPERRPSKKDQILSLYFSGITEVADLALMVNARPSYIASVLQESGQLSGYHDLYTSTAEPMNVYSRFFAGQLGFRDEETARESLALIDRLYRQFELNEDRAGQHHALVMALTMFDRARWTGKGPEAEVFRKWLLDRLQDQKPSGEPSSKAVAETPRTRRNKKA
jgi:hypothetical protein